VEEEEEEGGRKKLGDEKGKEKQQGNQAAYTPFIGISIIIVAVLRAALLLVAWYSADMVTTTYPASPPHIHTLLSIGYHAIIRHMLCLVAADSTRRSATVPSTHHP
jgi:hypothetical protein